MTYFGPPKQSHFSTLKPQDLSGKTAGNSLPKVSMLRGSDFTRSLLGKSIHFQYDDAACVRQPECKPLAFLCGEHKANFWVRVFVELVLGIGVKGVVRLDGVILRFDADSLVKGAG